MERLTNLIKEILSTPLKEKEGCNCGCGGCSKPTSKGITLNENIASKQILSENLQYHVHNKLPLTENTFRYGSESFINLWAEARSLYLREIIDINKDDKEILEETDLGNYGIYENIKVPLDMPLSVRANEVPLMNILRRAEKKGQEGYPFYRELADELRQESIDLNRVKEVLRDYGVYYEYEDLLNLNEAREPLKDISKEYLTKDMNLIKESDLFIEVSIDKDKIKINGGQEITDTVKDIQGYRVKTSKKFYETPREVIEALKDIKGRYYKYSITLEKTEFEEEEEIINYTFYLTPNGIREPLNEAKKKKKKDPPIGKPKRGGSKAYYVYVRDPRTKKVKKVSFGSGGLKAKINNPKARKAFAARHKCKTKTDKTKAGYWSCRLPRYAKLLGLKSSFSGFW